MTAVLVYIIKIRCYTLRILVNLLKPKGVHLILLACSKGKPFSIIKGEVNNDDLGRKK